MASASAGRRSGCACIRWSYSTQSGRPTYRTCEVTAFSIYYYPLVFSLDAVLRGSHPRSERDTKQSQLRSQNDRRVTFRFSCFVFVALVPRVTDSDKCDAFVYVSQFESLCDAFGSTG
jgi:hypothetical protein